MSELVFTGLVVKIENIENEFSDLARRLFSQLKSKKISIEELKEWIIFLPRSINVHVFPWWKSLMKSIHSKCTLENLFAILNMKVWNILDFSLLAHFIKMCKSAELDERMKIYITNLEKFKEETLVRDFIECWEGHSRDFPEYAQLEAKFEKENLTLADLDAFRKLLTKECIPSMLNYSSWIYYKHFKPGCCKVTWMLPAQLAMLVKRNIPTMCEILESFQVLQVVVAGTTVYTPHKLSYKGITLLL